MSTASKTEVLETIRELLDELSEKFSVRRIGVFGSFSRGDQGERSDVDVLVELDEPTFDHYMDLKFRLEEVLERPVDLVLADTVKTRLKPIVEKEVVYA
jgi:predicted nucleotidyltransferase